MQHEEGNGIKQLETFLLPLIASWRFNVFFHKSAAVLALLRAQMYAVQPLCSARPRRGGTLHSHVYM